ncbi:bifunctional phosphopantothenoylcysteine decarboxylase/phosphopantothenate--cysteine ligase CoaBC [Candidatus Acidulodesulfobacterium sp. H_13]|uniref:bifunctional phosphopantothenoylcysteine decarboxylase/phosphopantothenate--cysteine ligase CoaBC n=1 Tax=Candidatus Acidulodesulfobacterium sp. H_13 TaxID=3395470 RepID=UPI003AF48680
MALKDKNILLCVTGSIACYKSIDLYRRLAREGANVKIIVSASAAKFISPYIFKSFGEDVFADDAFKSPLAHIFLSKYADLILIAPATYNTINKLACGIADTLITLAISASRDKPKVMVPAMNPDMFAGKILKDNIDKLMGHNFRFVSPETGNTACGDFGEGKFPDINDIVFELESVFKEKTLKNRRVLITAGATREYLDPVRFISNASSGKMGISLANEAVNLGADVSLIALNIDTSCKYINKKVKITDCIGFNDLKETLMDEFKQCDILFMAAAVSDYSFKEESPTKIKKTGKGLNIELIQNEDLLKAISRIKEKKQIVFGFAAETDDIIDNGRKKLVEKSLDYIFINDVSQDIIGRDENEGFLIEKTGKVKRFEREPKAALAQKLLAEIN